MRPSLWWVAVTVAAACGGKAVIDGPSNDSGGGGLGGGPGGQGGGPGGSPGPGPGQGGGTVNYCRQACEALETCGGSPTEACAEACANVNPSCASLHQAWLSCIAPRIQPSTCVIGTGCEAFLNDYILCEAFCFNTSCYGDSSGNCGCVSDCDGYLETECYSLGDGTNECFCYSDTGMGRCVGTDQFDCFYDSCCGAFFFVN